MNLASSQHRIIFLVDQKHPRLCYALETIFQEFWGFAIELLLVQDAGAPVEYSGVAVLNYCLQPDARYPILACNGLLYEDIIRQANEEIDWFGAVSAQLHRTDHIAHIFYALSQYALLRPAARLQLDAHGRYPDGTGELDVHLQLAQLRELLQPHIPAFPAAKAFDFEITLDIDQPWKYLHKPFFVRWGGLLRDLASGLHTKERWQALRTGKDPFDVLSIVRDICPPEKTKVFFLVGGEHSRDSRFDLSMPAYQRYVRAYQAAGFGIGIHPSYEAMDKPALMPAQKAALEAIAGPVQLSRQHYLRYRTPDTFRQLIAAGISHDYSLCRNQGPGAVTGVAWPYRWFDLQRNVATHLTLVPAMVMDRSLQQYMNLEPAAALLEIEAIIAKTKAVGGKFVVILHNETFSDSGEWSGWQSTIRQMLQVLQQ